VRKKDKIACQILFSNFCIENTLLSKVFYFLKTTNDIPNMNTIHKDNKEEYQDDSNTNPAVSSGPQHSIASHTRAIRGLATLRLLSPTVAFALVSFSLGELGDGLNIFQGIYLVAIGWNEGSVGVALSLMGLTSLLVQTWAGDYVDKTTVDRRTFLVVASIVTAASAMAIMFVREGNQDHVLIFASKVIEGVASSFIGPCIAALTLATFGPDHFDKVMASNILYGHIGSVIAAVLAGALSYFLYPNIKMCFLVIAFSALIAVIFIPFLPEGDPQMGRGFRGRALVDPDGNEIIDNNDNAGQWYKESSQVAREEAASDYSVVFSDTKTLVLCVTGFFFHFANANVLLVLGELMGGDNDDGSVKKTAIPLIATAIVTAQVTMALTTYLGDYLTRLGFGRKILFLAALLSLPIRCFLIILWKDASEVFLLSTQIFDGIGGGLFGLLHPYLVADITFGTGRFNVVMGLSASCFGLGATLSNYLGQHIVEYFGHVTSLSASLFLSFVPIVLFAAMMPETYGQRGQLAADIEIQKIDKIVENEYVIA